MVKVADQLNPKASLALLEFSANNPNWTGGFDSIKKYNNDLSKFNYEEPSILKDYAKDWEAFKKWDFNFFRSKYGKLKVQVSRKVSTGQGERLDYEIEQLENYISELQSLSQNPYTLHSWLFELDAPELATDYRVGSQFENWFDMLPFELRPKVKFIFMGGSKTCTTVHVDPFQTSAWNTLLIGEKVWLFFPPSMSFDSSLLNTDSVLSGRLLELNPLIAIQKPSDLVYVPTGWYHAVVNLQPYLAITENFMSSSNADKVISHFASIGNHGYARILSAIKERKLGKPVSLEHGKN